MARSKNPTMLEQAKEGVARIEEQLDAFAKGDSFTTTQNQMAVHTGQILAQFGDGLPYDRLRYVDKARYHMARSAEEALALGRCLLVMKECEPHGEFTNCVESLGIEYTAATKVMKAALKFSNLATSQHLIEAAKSKSKLFELMMLDDEDLKELDAGRTVAGLTLDDVDRMSVSELRATLREAREDAKAKSRLMAEKNEKIDQLASKLAKRPAVETLPPDAQGMEFRQQAATFAYEAETVLLGKVVPAFEALLAHQEAHDVNHRAFMAGQLTQIERTLNELRARYGLQNALDSDPTPVWMRPGAEERAAEALEQARAEIQED